MKKYALAVFDFDGTLVDTVGDIAHYVNVVLAEKGYAGQHGIPAVTKAIGLGVHELLKMLEPTLVDQTDELEVLVDRFKLLYRQQPVLSTKPYPDVVDVLSTALAQTPKAILTNKPQDITEQILKELDLARHFEYVIGMNAGYPPKPDPAALQYLIQHLRYSKKDTVYIGDSRVDSETCQNAGVDFVWMDYGYDHVADGKYVHRFSGAKEWSKLTV